MTHLEVLQQARVTRDEFLQQAADSTGLDRARFLDEALSALDATIVEVYYADLVEEIGQLDPEDEAGLRTKYFAQRDREKRIEVMSSISMVARLRKPEDAIEFIDAALEEHKLPVEMWLTAQATKLRLLRSLERVDDANQLVDDMTRIEGIEPDARQRLIVSKAWYLVSLGQQDAAFAELESQIASSADNLLLTIGQGELHDSLGQFEEALQSYDKAITAAASQPEVLVEVVGAKADSLVELNMVEQAIELLDEFSANVNVPGSYRAEALLHKALILRENGRRRAAILAENKAIEVVDTIDEKAEIQLLVDQFRRKFDNTDGSQ